jgi:hypothetical protein
MDDDAFYELIDDATHAVNNLLPDEILEMMSETARSDLLVRINDALSPILRDVVGPPPLESEV